MHKRFLMQAYELAQERLGYCAPNPAVGCVLTKHNIPIAAAAHQACGQPHAEILALCQAGSEARGATAYITLAPCAHTGRTPPCTKALIEAGIQAVYYGALDPNPIAQGGIVSLSQAGIACKQISIPEIESFYAAYRHWICTGNAHLNAKLAISLDGKYAKKQATAMITGNTLERQTADFRSRHDVIVTSINTILMDDPQLNVRLDDNMISKPVIVLDQSAELPLSAQIFKTASAIMVFYTNIAPLARVNALQKAGVNCQLIDGMNELLDPRALPRAIGQLGFHTAWVETGGKWLASLLAAKQLNQLYLYVGNTILGHEAIPITFPQTDWLSNARDIHWQPVGSEAYCCITL